MAITKIIAIRDRLDKRVNYAVNGEKTTLDTGITYAANPEKTEQLFFTSAINCDSCETAFAEMRFWQLLINGDRRSILTRLKKFLTKWKMIRLCKNFGRHTVKSFLMLLIWNGM